MNILWISDFSIIKNLDWVNWEDRMAVGKPKKSIKK